MSQMWKAAVVVERETKQQKIAICLSTFNWDGCVKRGKKSPPPLNVLGWFFWKDWIKPLPGGGRQSLICISPGLFCWGWHIWTKEEGKWIWGNATSDGIFCLSDSLIFFSLKQESSRKGTDSCCQRSECCWLACHGGCWKRSQTYQ